MRLILTGRNDVVDDQDTLTRLDGITLYLEKVLSVFLFEGCSFGGSRQFPLLSDRNKAGTELQCQTGTEQEASCLKADNDVGCLALAKAIGDLQFEGS